MRCGLPGAHHQALRARGKADQLVQSGLQQRLVGARGQRIGRWRAQRVKASHDAAPLVERADGVHAAGEADVEVQARRAGQAGRVLAQGDQRVVVAGIQRQHVRGCRQRRRQRCAPVRRAAPRSAAPAGPAPGALTTAACRRTRTGGRAGLFPSARAAAPAPASQRRSSPHTWRYDRPSALAALRSSRCCAPPAADRAAGCGSAGRRRRCRASRTGRFSALPRVCPTRWRGWRAAARRRPNLCNQLHSSPSPIHGRGDGG
jgi:hypothetical protein